MKAPGVSKKHAGGTKHHAFHKHHGTRKHRPATPAQKAAAKRWQQAGAHAAHAAAVARKAGNKPPPPKWSPQSEVACCSAEALAASLRLTGHEVTEQDMLDLYWLTADDADSGAGLWETIEAAAEFGLAGVRPLDARPAVEMGTGVILGVDLAERHAVTLDGRGVWSWGVWRPVSAGFLAGADEAWVVTWP